jgi:cytochrome c peroxidase
MTAMRRLFFLLCAVCFGNVCLADCAKREVEFGQKLFESPTFSADGRTSCSTCHDPRRQFTTDDSVAIGVNGARGTRNAPSLLNLSSDSSFFWDGRRSSLEESVLDPFTNPVELGLRSIDELIVRVNRPALSGAGRQTYGRREISEDIVCYLRSTNSRASRYDEYTVGKGALTEQELRGLTLFRDVGGCAACHRMETRHASFTDNSFHHSGVQQDALETRRGSVALEIVSKNLSVDALGKKILVDPLWSATGRFAVTQDPKDMGSFKTPTLRNVAQTSPYMHDGSIATLKEAVDREIYYRAFSTGRPINLSETEREDIVAFLKTLSNIQSSL